MHDVSSPPNSRANLPLFFGLVFLISLPIYYLASFVAGEMVMLVGLVLALAPILAGLILVFRENGSDGVKSFLRRSFDNKRITNKIWYLPILFFWPVLFSLASGVLSLMGETTPDPLFPILAAPILFVLFFIFALFEELGWMGYAFEPMQERWKALKAGLLLGIIWGLWHIPMYILAGQEPQWIIWQVISLITIRILIVFIFNNTGKSVLGTILFHAAYNLCTLSFTSFYTSTGHLVTSLLIIITTIAVILLWDSKTLTQFRFCRREPARLLNPPQRRC